MKIFSAITALVLVLCPLARAQGNYEVQVYGAETLAPRTTMVEVHSNFTAQGLRNPSDGTAPTHHALHATLEITQGLNRWSELGFYVFTAEQPGLGAQWVGDHIRPRVRAPDSWHWPVGASLSMEVGYQRARFSPDTWTLEIRPIVDRELGRWYVAVNPALERTLHGPGVHTGLVFTPAVKVSYDLTPKVAAGLEYYGDYGNTAAIVPFRDQGQMFAPSIDLNLSPKWELNFAVAVGATAATDHWLFKAIVGRRFEWPTRKKGITG